jgi:hypothetical protein
VHFACLDVLGPFAHRDIWRPIQAGNQRRGVMVETVALLAIAGALALSYFIATVR